MAIFASGSDYTNPLDTKRATYMRQKTAVTVTINTSTATGLNTQIEATMDGKYIDGGNTTWERPGKN